ncbi:MAG: hypothetical protein K9J06_10160, partial [Flavobacteriales bacterium]|nr:hypothetical protein [Flavobacteriales bacterium]
MAAGLLVHKFLHSAYAGAVERFENVERSEEEGARAAGRIENGDLAQRVIEMAQQFGVIGALHDVLRKLTYVEVVGDELADGGDAARCDGGAQVVAPLPAGYQFAVGLGGQGDGLGRALIPAFAQLPQVGAAVGLHGLLLHIGPETRAYIIGQVVKEVVACGHPMAHSRVDVAVATLAHQFPHCAIGRERLPVMAGGLIEQEGNDGVLADVVGDVLLG